MSAAPTLSPQKLAANRANAQLSAGPKTPEGKAVSSMNALKTGLTGRTVLLSSEDAAAYETHLLRYVDMFAPQGERETELVQNLADTQWRLGRIPNLEAGFYALGRLRYADLFTPSETHLLDAYILQEDARHFKNLHLQESRLRRRYETDLKELKELQAERRQQEQEAQQQAKKIAAPLAQSAAVGFEFVTAPQSRTHSAAVPAEKGHEPSSQRDRR